MNQLEALKVGLLCLIDVFRLPPKAPTFFSNEDGAFLSKQPSETLEIIQAQQTCNNHSIPYTLLCSDISSSMSQSAVKEKPLSKLDLIIDIIAGALGI